MKPDPTQASLQRAFARLRKSHWPASLDAALQQPQLHRVITCLAHVYDAAPATTPAHQPAPVTAARPPLRSTGFDIRRAQANDLADD